MRIGILGGSFDPVHYGHLLMAELAREQFAFDRLWFMPAAVSPHKRNEPTTPGRQRAEMLERAVADHAAFEVSRLELERGGVSYTADTLQQIHRSQPEAQLFLLLGADAVADLSTWREPQRICRLARLVVAPRVGASEPDLAGLLAAGTPSGPLRLAMPLVELSSSEIRRRVAHGQSIRYQTPAAVIEYIETHGLYRG